MFRNKIQIIIISIIFICIAIILVRLITTSQLQRVTHTTKEQAIEIETILEEHNIIYVNVEWSEWNHYLSNQGIYEYYNLTDERGKRYILVLSLPDKKVECIEMIIADSMNQTIYEKSSES